VNISLNIKFKKLDDLCDQVFDYFHLAYYDLESKINNELNINTLKSKFETFADKHFKSAINDFEKEIRYLKYKSPHELIKLETISSEINHYFYEFINNKIFDWELLLRLKERAKESLRKI
jgi:hypothetical protein